MGHIRQESGLRRVGTLQRANSAFLSMAVCASAKARDPDRPISEADIYTAFSGKRDPLSRYCKPTLLNPVYRPQRTDVVRLVAALPIPDVRFISIIIEILLDAETIFQYSLKYEKHRCGFSFGRARARKPFGRIPPAGAGGVERNARRRRRSYPEASAEHAHVPFRSAARRRSRYGAARGPFHDLRGAI